MTVDHIKQMYCPKCKLITACDDDDTTDEGNWYLTKYKDINFYKRHRKCIKCDRKFLTAEIAEEFIFELGELRSKNGALRNENMTVNSAISKLREENKRLDSEIKKLRDENRKLNEELDEDETPNLKLKRQYEELKKLYEKMKNNESSNHCSKPSIFSSENSKVTNANYIGGSSDQVFRERDGRMGNTPSYDDYSDESEP